MPRVQYCHRCGADFPMLDEQEWALVWPERSGHPAQIPDLRRKAQLVADRDGEFLRGAFHRYFELTGYRETQAYRLWHHRLVLFGPPCVACGKPLRTPAAKFCAECGHPADKERELSSRT